MSIRDSAIVQDFAQFRKARLARPMMVIKRELVARLPEHALTGPRRACQAAREREERRRIELLGDVRDPLPALGRCDRGGADQQASQRGLIGKRGAWPMPGETVRQKPLCTRSAIRGG
jgi:hypothetical protein